MNALGFRFEHPAIVLDGWAHRPSCETLPVRIPDRAMRIDPGGIFGSEFCPGACRVCQPDF